MFLNSQRSDYVRLNSDGDASAGTDSSPNRRMAGEVLRSTPLFALLALAMGGVGFGIVLHIVTTIFNIFEVWRTVAGSAVHR